jgi:hypothetical protein
MRFLYLSVRVCALVLLFVAGTMAQETTGGLQGTVKDPSGAVVPNAHVVVTGSTLVGSKEADTDTVGYYRFANLPPGHYTITVTAKGFSASKRELVLEVGHLPNVDFSLEMGASTTVVEVTAANPLIDTTKTENLTNVTDDVIANVPHGYSFQSVIQFAPMARNEPLAGGSAGLTGNSGGSPPGSAGNGLAVGFSIGGAADSESSYLVEGQDTENISAGASNANVPFEFIQEVEVKTSGIEAEHGGALGGVVNVVMKKGGNAYHGSLFSTYESDSFDGSQNANLRYDPQPGVILPNFDNDSQTYQPKRDHFRIAQPGFTVGGPIAKDRLWFFAGFAPFITSRSRTVDFGPSVFPVNSVLGSQAFTQDRHQYFGSARLDASLTQKIRLYGSWLYQYTRESGDSLPTADSVNKLLNTSINAPLAQYSHGLGFSAPNATYNVGADITLTPKIVATTRYGYTFYNYRDFGWPTSGVNLNYTAGGKGQLDNAGNLILPPNDLAVPSGTTTAPYNPTFTEVNANKHYQFDQDIAFFKGGWWGTHNFKFGYQLNHLSNVINQHGSLPLAFMNVGAGQSYIPSTAFGGGNCATLAAANNGNCAGQYGYVVVQDFATVLKTPAGAVVPATDTNHAFFVQDAWTVGHGLTLSLGLRVEKERLPAPAGLNGVKISTIDFGWSDKIAPRLGVAWGSRNGKIKIFGSYGVVNDVMKLLLAQTSWGAQGFETCAYPLGPDATGGFSNSDINLVFNSVLRACPTGVSSVGAVFGGTGAVPQSLTDAKTGTQLIENLNFRPEEPIAPGVKPYRQHEFVVGWDYQISRDFAFEVRYDRRRLDHVIEDASLADPSAFEIYTVVNPGEGVNKTLDGYAKFLTSLGNAFGPGTAAFNGNPATPFGTCPTCPNNPKAIRNYDGVEFRLTHTTSKHWNGLFSYTWSRLWGNYTGLTTTDQIDGGTTGRNSPDTTRSFDEPFYYFGANGKSNSGPLPTDRPNTFKGYVYYQLPWGKGQTTTFGLFQTAYQGSPVSSYVDLGLAALNFPIEATYIFGHGKWANVTADPATGAVTLGAPYDRRTPWYTQTDINFGHKIKVGEGKAIAFEASAFNVLNQHAVTAYWGGFGSNWFNSGLFPDEIFLGASFYQKLETGYNAQAQINAQANGTCTFCQIFGRPLPLIKDSNYGKPNLWQLSRNLRLGVRFTF